MKKMFLAFVLAALFAVNGSAQFYSDVTFVGSVHTGGYHAVSGISAGVTNGGYYTNAVATTNYYRLCGTNAAGRIPLSTNIAVAWTPGTGTNAVRLSWTRAPGINRHVIEKSYDSGTTWTNWLTVGPDVVTWLDTGSNTWTATTFTNLYAQIPAGTYPWASTGDFAAHTAAAGTNVHGLGTAATSNAADFATAAQGAKADSAVQPDVAAAGLSSRYYYRDTGYPYAYFTWGSSGGSPGWIYDSDEAWFYMPCGYTGWDAQTLRVYFTAVSSDVIWDFGVNAGSYGILTNCVWSGRPIALDKLSGTVVNFVSPPASNSAAGATGQWATGITAGTNFLYFYNPDGGGTGTGRWVRAEGSVTW